MLINEIEKKVGITKNNIRFYEKVGLLSPKRDLSNGYRDYSESDINLIKKIISLRKLNFSIEQIKEILGGKTGIEDYLENHIECLQNDIEHSNKIIEVCNDLLKTDNLSIEDLSDDIFINSNDNQFKHDYYSDKDLLMLMPDDLKVKYLESHLNNNTEDILGLMTKYFDQQIKESLKQEKTIKRLIESTENSYKSKMIGVLKELDPILYTKLKCHIYDIEEIQNVPKETLKKTLESISRTDILIAMKTMSPQSIESVVEILDDTSLIGECKNIGAIRLKTVIEIHDRILKDLNYHLDLGL